MLGPNDSSSVVALSAPSFSCSCSPSACSSNTTSGSSKDKPPNKSEPSSAVTVLSNEGRFIPKILNVLVVGVVALLEVVEMASGISLESSSKSKSDKTSEGKLIVASPLSVSILLPVSKSPKSSSSTSTGESEVSKEVKEVGKAEVEVEEEEAKSSAPNDENEDSNVTEVEDTVGLKPSSIEKLSDFLAGESVE